ncbi:MAG: GNAT family N-acetyltransferase [Chitinophagales bacterium]|nr:GNAT family N-acetyltransferase [Chitinophagales bacterium]
MKIVEAELNRLDELSVMFDAYRIFYHRSSDIEGVRNFLHDRIINRQSVIFLAIEEHQSAVAFAQLYPLFSSINMKPVWLLNDLFVRPQFRNKGISKLLLEKCKILAAESMAHGVLLETEKTNMVGNHLYPSAGFKLYDQTNFYFYENPNY